ncbi:MAG: STAS/SEC14 domain-containing protein [Thermoleophilaceae bacterium]|nr:STAS/SEC14 domain-containing protein [Thermoleophilaceae bacterium]
MIEPLADMPRGTLGFRTTGRVSGDDYREVLLPALRSAVESGDVRMVFEIGPGFEEFELGALAQDARAGLTLGLAHPRAWRRTALVTEVEWVSKAFHMFAWMVPGEARVFGLDGLDEAKAWVAG